jgi:hypothetical protein
MRSGEANRERTMGSTMKGLRARIHDQIDPTLFDEAARCLRAGADRAAYIMA